MTTASRKRRRGEVYPLLSPRGAGFQPAIQGRWQRQVGNLPHVQARRLLGTLCVTSFIVCLLPTASLRGQDPPPPEPLVRELFIPFENLHTVLEGQPRRVLLSRDEYADLMARVKKSDEARAPVAAALTSAEITVAVAAERAVLTGVLAVEVMEDGLQIVPLDLSGVGLASATLDDQPAAIGRADDGRLLLFVAGKGRHPLTLNMTAPVQTTAAQQVLNVRLPTPAAAKITLTVPGDVEIKSGAAVVSRVVDGDERLTRFELLATRGDLAVVMSLNSRLKRQDRLVVASSVLVDDVTLAYERLHATVSLAVLHQAIDQARFVVPDGFEPTSVSSPNLARWAVVEEGGRKVLDVNLREATTDPVVLAISALRTPARLRDWTMPTLEPLDVVGQVAVVGLLVEDRLQAASLASTALLPIDTAALTQALPASVFQAEPGAPTIRPVAAFYAPQGDYTFSAVVSEPAPRVRATTNLLLIVSEEGHEVHGGFALLADVEPLFSFDFSVPSGWQVDTVTGQDGSALVFDRFGGDAGARIHVRLPAAVRPGATYSVHFVARHTPAGWLGEWPRFAATFPVFAATAAARDVGAIAVAVRGDMTVRPETLEGLSPLAEQEKAKYGLAGVVTNLAYHYDSQPYQAALTIERTLARLTAQTYSFVRVEPAALAAHYEVVYAITGAGVRSLSLSLPESTPTALAISALDGVGIKEFVSQTEGDLRRWTVQLTESRQGTVRLVVDFQQPLGGDEQAELKLPVVKAEGVAYQSGTVAVEGSADLDVEVLDSPRKVDVGELVDAQYQPGKRLLGAYGFVGDAGDVTIRVARPSQYALQPVIVERAELTTMVSAQGLSETAARFHLRSKAQYVEVVLPDGSQLWSTAVDGRPTKPQRQGGSLLVSLAKGVEGAVRDLQIVYETPISPIDLSGVIDVPAPVLKLRADRDTPASPVPVANLVWYLHLPTGYRVVRSDGTVMSDEARPPELAALTVARWLWKATGGIGHGLLPSLSVARYASRKSSKYDRGIVVDSEGYERLGGRDAWPITSSAPAEFAGEPMKYPAALDDSMSMDADQADAPAAEEAREMPVPADGVPTGIPAPTPEMDEKAAAPPQGQPDPQSAEPKKPAAPETTASTQAKGGWALEGVRSLKIDLIPSAEPVKFESLGEAARLNVSLAERRGGAFGWALALAVLLCGLFVTNRSVRSKAIYLIAISLSATLVALVSTSVEVILFANQAFYAASLLAVWYMLVASVRWLGAARNAKPTSLTALLLAAISVSLLAPARAQEANPTNPPVVIQVEPPGPPVVVPPDAILVPYDPDKADDLDAIDQILVPYDKYRELWEQAHADQTLTARPPPAPFALAGAAFKSTLTGDEFLTIDGRLDLEVFTEEHVSIPLAVEGGVLAKAELDGKPARLRVVRVDPHQAAQAAAAPPPAALITLDVQGKGKHRLDLTVRLRLERRGGWRVATGRLPAAPATSLALRVPRPGTEVRLAGLFDRPGHETKAADETIATSLSLDGALQIQWRAKVDQGEVDRNLTARSTALVDVREDGLRLVWQLTLEFPRTTRDAFSLRIPSEYLVERVEGNNVRGWEVKPADDGQALEIGLLNTARDAESVTVVLGRHGAVGQGDLAALAAPFVAADGAALHTGVLAIRRSPGLDLRTTDTGGVKRADFPADAAVLAERAAAESPLGIVPFQAYQFAGTPFSIRLAAARLAPRTTATVETVLKIAARQRTLETRIHLDVQARPIHEVRLAVPADWQLDQVSAPGRFEWTRTEEEDRAIVTVRMAEGQLGKTSLVLAGVLGEPAPVERLALPNLAVLDVERQQGDVVVQVDPAFDVEAVDLADCGSVLVSTAFGWLKAEQRDPARLVLHYETPEYGGALVLRARQALVTSTAITNVRVTGAAVERTILLEFTIREAGVREISFLLPAEMLEARISVPMLRQKTIETVAGDPAGRVRVKLELQDDVMDQLRVLVEHDRGLTLDEYEAPLATVETGRTDRRYIALQSAGRDEVSIVSQEGLEALGRQQASFQRVADLLESRLTQVYLVNPGAAAPKLVFQTRGRQTVETAGARIGLAETALVLDAQGTYRAAQIYRLDNATEQYLELELPAGAVLWTALVAGEPVKPAAVAGGAIQASDSAPRARRAGGVSPPVIHPGGAPRVRIPLVKTAAGDLDYEVAVKYGGTLAALGKLATVSFPLIRTVNIHVEQSQVRLYLPETHDWFDFGGSLGRVANEADLAAGFLSYQSKLLQRLSQTRTSDNAFAKARATNNTKQIELQLHDYLRSNEGQAAGNEAFKQEAANTERTLKEAESQSPTEGYFEDVAGETDNRGNLNRLYEGQETRRSKNVVNELGANFDSTRQPQQQPLADQGGKGQEFNNKWFLNNNLNSQDDKPKAQPGPVQQFRGVVGVNTPAKDAAPTQTAAQPANPEVAQGKAKADLQMQADEAKKQSGAQPDADFGRVSRYKQKLAKQADQQLDRFGGEGQGGGQSEKPQAPRPPDQNAPAGTMGVDSTGFHPGLFGQEVAEGVSPTAGLASLDFSLPERGRVYRFATPRGEIELTARAVSGELVERFRQLALALAAALVLLLAYQVLRRGWFATRLGSTLAIVGGLISLCAGLLPGIGLVALVGGIVCITRRWFARGERGELAPR